MKDKIKVPRDYFIEMSNELAHSYQQAKDAPKFQLDRIKAVVLSGKDFETMGNGYTVSLDKLIEFYQKAKRVDIEALKKEWTDFVGGHEIDDSMQGSLKQAKIDVEVWFENDPAYSDELHNYELHNRLAHEYFLNEKQMDSLLEHIMDLEMEY